MSVGGWTDRNYGHKKGFIVIVCDNVHRLGGCDLKWNKPDTKDRYHTISAMCRDQKWGDAY